MKKYNVTARVGAAILAASMIMADAPLVSAAELAGTAVQESSGAEVQAVTADAPVSETGESAQAEEAASETAEGTQAEEQASETAEGTQTEEQTSETEADAGTEASAAEENSIAVQAASETPAAVSDTEASMEETEKKLGAKVVSPTALADVTGIAYNPSTNELSWNKVPGAVDYQVTVTDASGNKSVSWSNGHLHVYPSIEDNTAYTVSVRAYNDEQIYLAASGVSYGDIKFSWSSSTENRQWIQGENFDVSVTRTAADGVTTYDLYKYPMSANAASAVISRPATNSYVSALSGIAYKEAKSSSVVFTVAPAQIQADESIEYEYSNNAEFKSDGNDQFVSKSEVDTRGGIVDDIQISLSRFQPGETMYVRARVYNANLTLATGQSSDSRYSAYVQTSYVVPATDTVYVAATVTGSSVRLTPSSNMTGYQYQRKNGKKWTDLGTTSDSYVDEGLKADTKYTYRVRGYQYNETTKKTAYTGWKQISAYTWGANLDLHAAASSSTAVKLTWNKVAKADGYEIYRREADSSSYTIDQGVGVEDFGSYTLVKSQSAKKKAYTDKKLAKDVSYAYLVRAYRTVGKTKCYIEDSAYITLGKLAALQTTSYYKSNGSVIVKWDKMTGISGIKVEKFNPVTGKYDAYRTLKKTATSITLPQVAAGSAEEKYNIRTYSGSRILSERSVTVEPKLAAVKNVKAVKTAEGVKVTWSPVAGADYYVVYRCSRQADTYNKTTKLYSGLNSQATVQEAVYDTSSSTDLAAKQISSDGTYYSYDNNLKVAGSGYLYNYTTSYQTSRITGTSVVDRNVTVQSLIRKEDLAGYDKNTDPEYVVDSDGDGYYRGSYGEYVKNTDHSLATKTVTMVEGPTVGNDYYYYVKAVAKSANGANGNDDVTYSAGYIKGAKVSYTSVTAKAAKLKSAKSSKKGTATIGIKKVSGAKGYAIYRSTRKNGSYIKVGMTTGKNYTDSNVTAGKTYYYKVASYKTSESGNYVYSKLSAAKKVKIKK